MRCGARKRSSHRSVNCCLSYHRAGGLPPLPRCVHLWRTLNGKIIETVRTRRGAHWAPGRNICEFEPFRANSYQFPPFIHSSCCGIPGTWRAPNGRPYGNMIPFNVLWRLTNPVGGGKPPALRYDKQQFINILVWHYPWAVTSGKRTEMVVPTFSWLSTRMSAPSTRAECLTMDSPSPVPPTSLERLLSTR